MSAALLRKSLELCDTPFVVVSDKRELRYKGFTDQSKPKKTQRGVTDVERKNITCIEQVKKKRKQQKKKEETLRKKLEILKKPVVGEKLAKTILESTKKRGEGDREVIFLKKNLPEQESIFSEEDFARFAREYTDDS
uniref:Active regulator of SIRT1 n=1 Tax=Lygus hesperus TaxID=30085 RepID=A0A0A9YF93_LYGHE